MAGGGGGRFERGRGALALVALLHLAAHVEHRVVHADGEADEQDDRADLVGDGGELADRAEQAERRADGGHAEQQRQAGGDERAEGDQQDDQRERDRQGLGALEVVAERLVERLARRRPSRSARRAGRGWRAAPPRWRRASRRRGRRPVVVAGDLERQQRRAPVLGDLAGRAGVERRDDLLDVRVVASAAAPAGRRPVRARRASRRRDDEPGCSTCSPLDLRKPASATATSAAFDEPLPICASSSEFVPIIPPPTVARTTNAIQPRIAILRCCALQRPARAARFVGLMTAPVVDVIVRSLSTSGASESLRRAGEPGVRRPPSRGARPTGVRGPSCPAAIRSSRSRRCRPACAR